MFYTKKYNIISINNLSKIQNADLWFIYKIFPGMFLKIDKSWKR